MSPKRNRRGPGEGHIKKIRLKSGKFAYRGWLVVGYRRNDDGTKTAIRRTVQHRRFDAVVEGLERLRAKYRVGLDLQAEAEMRLSVLFEKWLAHFIATVKHKKRTPGTYRWAIKHARAQLGDPLVARVSPIQLQEALNQLGQKLAPSSLNLVRVVLDSAFSQAVLWRIRPDNPASDLKLPRERDAAPAPRRVLTPAEGLRYVEALQAERLGLAVALCYAVGMRPNEVSALRIEDVDLEALSITVAGAHNVVDRAVEREDPKTWRGRRTLPLLPELAPWVRQRIARAKAERVAMAHKWTEADEGLLFVRETDGGKLSNHLIYQVARRVAERADLGTIGPRILRRSMLSLLAAQGVDPKVRAAIGGHTTAITEKHYNVSEVDPADVSAAISRMSSLLPELPAPEEDAS